MPLHDGLEDETYLKVRPTPSLRSATLKAMGAMLASYGMHHSMYHRNTSIQQPRAALPCVRLHQGW